MNWIEALILSVIEGITEFLPISSTGHMVIASSFMGIQHEGFVKLFTVAIQFGAILSVVVLYWKRFFKSLDFYYKLFVAFVPAIVFGILFSKKIDELLESPMVVGIMLLLGGIIFLYIDKWIDNTSTIQDENPSYKKAITIGFFQCLAMIPGVSRSAATIIGGLTQKLTRKAAAEFSFFLAVPTMFGATAKKLFDYYREGGVLSSENIKILAFGNIVAFIVAMFAIKFFISILTKYGFKAFGYYRIAAGLVILIMIFMGCNLTI